MTAGDIRWADITMDDLPESLRDIAEVIGIKAVVALMEHMGGERVYIHKPDRIKAAIRSRQIRKEFTGANIRELCRRYRVSETLIRSIIAK